MISLNLILKCLLLATLITGVLMLSVKSESEILIVTTLTVIPVGIGLLEYIYGINTVLKMFDPLLAAFDPLLEKLLKLNPRNVPIFMYVLCLIEFFFSSIDEKFIKEQVECLLWLTLNFSIFFIFYKLKGNFKYIIFLTLILVTIKTYSVVNKRFENLNIENKGHGWTRHIVSSVVSTSFLLPFFYFLFVVLV